MKNKSYQQMTVVVPLFSVLTIFLIVLVVLLGNEYYENKSLNEHIEKLNLENSMLKNENDSKKDNEDLLYIYDCSFTKTYNVVELIEDYISEVPEYSYIVVDEFQSHYLKTIRIPSILKKGLKEQKYYEIIYTLKGSTNEIVNNIDYINEHISLEENNDFNITIEIKETNKLGNDQINEQICTYERTFG